ncbi:hypothetical protein [Pseudomonas syringae]|uniref:hypothetical protein n=1 Tax=Pseudomonas syringae TaxID=317 RepID=UPI0004633F77|nr:hypothetical protein [Pseudomonas syringae]
MKVFAMAIAVIGTMASGSAFGVPMIYGDGNRSCGQFVSDTTNNRQMAVEYLSWTSGVATALSANNEVEYFKGTDTPSVLLWLQNYCRTNPLSQYVDATLDLLKELKKRQEK